MPSSFVVAYLCNVKYSIHVVSLGTIAYIHTKKFESVNKDERLFNVIKCKRAKRKLFSSLIHSFIYLLWTFNARWKVWSTKLITLKSFKRSITSYYISLSNMTLLVRLCYGRSICSLNKQSCWWVCVQCNQSLSK